MGDPLKKVLPGQPLSIPAEAYNSFIDAARSTRLGQHDQTSDATADFRQSGIIKVRNDSGASRERFDVLALTSPLITPSANLREFQRTVAMQGGVPTADDAAKFVVLQEPLATGRIGRAVLAGTTTVKIDVTDESHTAAEMEEGECGHLKSATSGSARILWKESGTGVKWAVVRLGERATAAGVNVVEFYDPRLLRADGTIGAEFRANNSGSIKWASAIGDLAAVGVTNLFDDFDASSKPSLRIDQAGCFRVSLNWAITRAGQWSSDPAQEPANIMGSEYTTSLTNGHTHQVTARGYQSLVITAQCQFRWRHSGATSWNVVDRASLHNLVAYDLGMNTNSNRRMSASASGIFNFESGDELSFLAAIIQWFGAANGASIYSANLMLERIGDEASVTTWG